MTPTEIAYARLLTAVWLAGLTLGLERVDQWLAGFDVKPKPVRDRHGIPEDDEPAV